MHPLHSGVSLVPGDGMGGVYPSVGLNTAHSVEESSANVKCKVKEIQLKNKTKRHNPKPINFNPCVIG